MPTITELPLRDEPQPSIKYRQETYTSIYR